MINPTRYLMNIKEPELDAKIFRFISFESLCEILLFKKLTLPKINTWDDPYENYLLKMDINKVSDAHKTIPISPALQELKNRLYGQCWTLNPESDALWRIYSSNSRGVRISTTLRKLYEVINVSESKNDSICLGKVNYQSLDKIEQYLTSLKYVTEVNANSIFESILIKRNEFLHENEIRIIYAAGLDFEKDIKQYNIDINNFINSIMFDPRISKRYETLYRAAIETMGFKNEVTKSSLYEFKQLSINIS